jgi:hypothetical protein
LVKKGFMCAHCEYNWRGCHNPRRPSVTWAEGCSDFWRKGKPREPEVEKLSSEWIEGLDLSGLGKKKKRGRQKEGMSTAKARAGLSTCKWDVRVASPRRLFRALHDFLDEWGYLHEYEPLRVEADALSGTAVFKSQLLGKIDTPKRDRPYLVFGIILLPTLLLTSLGTRFIRASRYTRRTLATIGVEGEAYLARGEAQGAAQDDVPDVVSDARITLDITAGAARGDFAIWKPTDNKRELARLVEEKRQLEGAISAVLAGMALPLEEAAE